MTDQPRTPEQTLINNVHAYVKQYMSHYDGSHDFAHVQRVLGLARRIAAGHSAASTPLDPLVVTLAALLHDVGDRKYLQPGQDGARMVYDVLRGFGAAEALAEKVQVIVNAVSYSAEVRDPQKVRDVMARCPELAAVQDADRLDAIGAVGIGRTFTYGGAKGGQSKAGGSEVGVASGSGAETGAQGEIGRGRSMEKTIEHFTVKLERLEGMMKTDLGRALARERTRRLVQFRQWWDEEVEAAHEGLTMGGGIMDAEASS
jgi:uncharacterized protein